MRRVVLVVVCTAAAMAAAPHAVRSQDLNRRGAAVDRLHVWMDTVDRHQPGTLDDDARRFASWPPALLDDLWIDLQSLLGLMLDPRKAAFFMWIDGGRGEVRRQVVYTGSELERLRALSRESGGHDPQTRADPEDHRRVVAAHNRVLKRAAAMHTAVALSRPSDVVAGRERTPASGRPTTVLFADGREVGVDRSGDHWRFARMLLGAIVPSAAADEAVRSWYRASSAALLRDTQLYREHLEAALRLFPDDPELLMFAGSLHETLASARVQEFLRTASLPGLAIGVGSARTHLRQAESLLRRAVRLEPRAAEARVRLGRVLSLQERYDEAVGELRQVGSTAAPVLQYYAHLFVGDAAEAMGRVDEARVAYARAAALYPRAQAPRLALSRLAAIRGDFAAAVDVLAPVMSSSRTPADDPFWSYYTAAGRDAGRLLDVAYQQLAAEAAP